jgi:hypothetical protein
MAKEKSKRTATRYIRHLKARIRKNKKAFIVYSILRILVLLTMIRSIITGDYESTFTCVLVLLLFLLPAFAEDVFKMEVPQLFQIIIYLFIFAAEILGEINRYFVRVPGWDSMLHTMNGFLCAAVGFSLVYLLNRNSDRIELSPFYMALVAFCFSMTIGVLWEFFECFVDLHGGDMQKDFIVQSFNSVKLDPQNRGNVVHVRDITRTIIQTGSGAEYVIDGGYLDIGLLDTMKDLFVNFIGAIVFVIIGFLYVRKDPNRVINSGLILKPAGPDGEESKQRMEENLRYQSQQLEERKKAREEKEKSPDAEQVKAKRAQAREQIYEQEEREAQERKERTWKTVESVLKSNYEQNADELPPEEEPPERHKEDAPPKA